MKIKRLFSMLLCVLLCISSMPVTAVSANNSEAIYVNGIDILSAENYTVACGEGTAVYDFANRKLTLTNASITTPATQVTSNFKEEYGIYSISSAISGQDFTIELVGENSISLIHDGMCANGIWLPSANLTISGDGSLDISLGYADGTNSSPHAIYANTVAVSSKKLSTKLSLDSQTKKFAGTAILGKNGISLKDTEFTCSFFEWGMDERTSTGTGIAMDNAVVTLTDVAEAIVSSSTVSIANGSDVEAHGKYVAINASDNILISGSKVVGSSTEDYYNAIISWGDLTIEKSADKKADVTVTSYYPALYADDALKIDGSVVSATSTNDAGIYSYEPIKITDSNITAKGLTAICSVEGVEISKSTLEITGEQTGIYTMGNLSMTECKEMSLKAGYNVIAEVGNGTTINDCTGTIESTGVLIDPADPDSGRITGVAVSSNALTVQGDSTDLTISGGSAIDCYGNMTILGGKLSAVGTNGGAIDIEGILDFRGGELHAKGSSRAINARTYSDQTDLETTPADTPELIKLAENYGEANGAKIAGRWYVASIYDGDTDQTVKKWRYDASFIPATDDTGVLQEYNRNTVKEITLKIKGADYSAVNAAITTANALNKNQYKDFSAVDAAITAVDWSKNITEQTTVDGYATAIENAMNALEYKDADYTAVDAAIAKVNALDKEQYKDFSAVDAAVAAVVRGKNITEQATVDGYATAIENAMNALEHKDADYTAVDAAIAKVNALNPEDYIDFSAVEQAVNAVVRDLDITQQSLVDDMAKAIESAIQELDKKPTVMPGDVNEDGIVDAEDALLVLRHAALLEELTGDQFANADMNGDLVLTADDALEILKISAQLQ